MGDVFSAFERLVRTAHRFTEARSLPRGGLHPFDERNIHAGLPAVVRELFDDGHYSQATFEAYKYVDEVVQRLSGLNESGFKLMLRAFDEASPLVQLTSLSTQSETDEQHGYRFIFAGSVMAIRNPRGHKHSVVDTPDQCLDHLALASMLLRRLEEAGLV
ncbi:MAG: TIGR02391 family protein [Candidatus Bipolaricaulota bacterium]|nr:TIGR02391 family protein [Candidatus Bipolaricaulota bacterium]